MDKSEIERNLKESRIIVTAVDRQITAKLSEDLLYTIRVKRSFMVLLLSIL